MIFLEPLNYHQKYVKNQKPLFVKDDISRTWTNHLPHFTTLMQGNPASCVSNDFLAGMNRITVWMNIFGDVIGVVSLLGAELLLEVKFERAQIELNVVRRH
jgi:hypothetical protein